MNIDITSGPPADIFRDRRKYLWAAGALLALAGCGLLLAAYAIYSDAPSSERLEDAALALFVGPGLVFVYKRENIMKAVFWFGTLFTLLLLPEPTQAGFAELSHPERLGVGLTWGHSYDPSPTFGFGQLTGVFQYDYDRVWPHRAPEALFFKLEGSLGLASYQGNERLLASANMLAQYYLAPKTDRLRPYLEAGIGLIYSDFQGEEQGLRLNFNPQAGLGCDYQVSSGTIYFSNLRLHHLSNGELHHDNRGANSLLLQIGRYF